MPVVPEYVSITDEEALQAFYALSRNEGILPRWNPPTRWPMP